LDMDFDRQDSHFGLVAYRVARTVGVAVPSLSSRCTYARPQNRRMAIKVPGT